MDQNQDYFRAGGDYEHEWGHAGGAGVDDEVVRRRMRQAEFEDNYEVPDYFLPGETEYEYDFRMQQEQEMRELQEEDDERIAEENNRLADEEYENSDTLQLKNLSDNIDLLVNIQIKKDIDLLKRIEINIGLNKIMNDEFKRIFN